MLTQSQRIEVSKKIVSIPLENQNAQNTKDLLLNVEKPKAIEADDANKSIIDQRTPAINGYQSELQMLDGNGRTQIVEQDYQDASQRKLGNYFYYNKQDTPTPSNPDGIWKNLLPFLLGYGIGKDYNEGYNPVQKEQDLIDAFNSAVSAFEVFHPMERCTGQNAVTNLTPPPPATIATFPDVQTALTNLTTAVTNYNNFLTSQSSVIYTADSNVTRQTQSVTAKNNIDTIIKPAITLWQSYNNFNTSHGQTTVAGFYGYNTTLLAPTKGNPLQLDVLKAAVSARQTFINSTRIPQLNSYLGSVSQDLSNGEITAKSGLYGERSLAIVMRLGVMGGSLSKIASIDLAAKTQDSVIGGNAISGDGYDLIIKVEKFKAPANNTNIIHVPNASTFSVGDAVFVCGDGQAELSGTVVAVSGTRIDLDFQVPQKYTPQNFSRIYKPI
jgi:hypothetical protein